MKKEIILTLLLLVFASTSFASEKEVEIKTTEGLPRPRSLTIPLPTVTIDDELFTLSLQFAVTGSIYTVIVKDVNGIVLFQQQVTSSLTLQTYSMPALSQGIYSITIDSETNSFSGKFEI